MRKVIGAFNMTLDGFCDHTAGIPDEEIHQHYADLLSSGDAALYGRTTYQLMTYWQTLVQNPTGNKELDDFAVVMDKVPKVIFSHTLKDTDPMITGWESARLASLTLEKEVLNLKQQQGKDIIVGSRSLIIQLLNHHLIDEFQLCIYPVIEGKGLSLFENINHRTFLKLVKTKTFKGGAVILYYEPQMSDF